MFFGKDADKKEADKKAKYDALPPEKKDALEAKKAKAEAA